VTASPPTHLSESLHRVSAIDALRGLAALLVLFYHARGMFWIGFSQTWHQYGLRPDFNALLGYLSVPLSYGSLGVTLFFVLSGYCIHRRGAGQLVVDPRASIDLKAFAVRRFWRIYPTYLCALLITALIDGWILARTGIRDPAQDDSLHAFLVSLVTLQGYLAVYFGTNGVFWTLAMEVHLYLAYPILFYLSRRFGPGRTLLFTVLVHLGHGLFHRGNRSWPHGGSRPGGMARPHDNRSLPGPPLHHLRLARPRRILLGARLQWPAPLEPSDERS
jgi:peptidoglycan/LPS O-acetylase OafA/YrhL